MVYNFGAYNSTPTARAPPGRDAGGSRPKVFDLLAYLIHHDQFVAREKLYAAVVQPFVSDATPHRISEARNSV
jgi:hypothetical protein